MNFDITCLDIDSRLLDFVAHRIANFNHRVNFVHCDIHNYNPDRRFDIVIFHKSFHHYHNHQLVLKKMSKIVSDSGIIVFAAEPIISLPDIALPYPWGLRMDGVMKKNTLKVTIIPI